MNAVAVPASSRRRWVSLVVLALLIGGPLGWSVWALYAAAVTAGINEGQSTALAGLQSRLSKLRAEGGAAFQTQSVYLPGATSAIAGAALQKLIADSVTGAGGRVVESEFARTEAVPDDPGRVDLRVSFDAEIVSLQHILFQLETGLPILTMRGLTVQSAGAEQVPNTESPPLRVILLVGGYWEAGK